MRSASPKPNKHWQEFTGKHQDPTMKLDTTCDDTPERLYIDIPERNMSVCIALTDEGIVVDVFAAEVRDEAIATCYAFTTDTVSGDN
jgi:hypothetical protein